MLWYALVIYAILYLFLYLFLISLPFIIVALIILLTLYPVKLILFLITGKSIYLNFEHVDIWVIMAGLVVGIPIAIVAIKRYMKLELKKQLEALVEQKRAKFAHTYREGYEPKNFPLVKRIIAESCNINARAISVNSRLDSDLGLTCQDVIKVLRLIEFELNINFSQEIFQDLEKGLFIFKTIGDVVYLTNRTAFLKRLKAGSK